MDQQRSCGTGILTKRTYKQLVCCPDTRQLQFVVGGTLSSSTDQKPGGDVFVKGISATDIVSGHTNLRGSLTKAFLVPGPDGEALAVDAALKLVQHPEAHLHLLVTSRRSIPLGSGCRDGGEQGGGGGAQQLGGSWLDLKLGASMEPLAPQVRPVGHVRWHHTFERVTEQQDLGLVLGLDWLHGGSQGDGAGSALARLLLGGTNVLGRHVPSGLPPLLPLLLLPLRLLRRRRRAAGKGGNTRLVRFADGDAATAAAEPEAAGTAGARVRRGAAREAGVGKGDREPAGKAAGAAKRGAVRRRKPGSAAAAQPTAPATPPPAAPPQQQRRPLMQALRARVAAALPQPVRGATASAGRLAARCGRAAAQPVRWVLAAAVSVLDASGGDLHFELVQRQRLPECLGGGAEGRTRLRLRGGRLQLLCDM